MGWITFAAACFLFAVGLRFIKAHTKYRGLITAKTFIGRLAQLSELMNTDRVAERDQRLHPTIKRQTRRRGHAWYHKP